VTDVSAEASVSCRFYVEIDGFAQAVFTEVDGLQLETEMTEVEEGGSNGHVHRLPGRTRVGNLTLKRGMTATHEFFRWYLSILQGTMLTRNLSIVMYDPQGQEVTRWNFLRAYPVKWIGPQFTADGTAVAIETLEFAHHGLILG